MAKKPNVAPSNMDLEFYADVIEEANVEAGKVKRRATR